MARRYKDSGQIGDEIQKQILQRIRAQMPGTIPTGNDPMQQPIGGSEVDQINRTIATIGAVAAQWAFTLIKKGVAGKRLTRRPTEAELQELQGYINTSYAQGVAAGMSEVLASLRSDLRAIYARYGLDPANPGHGLANIDYFIRRAYETNPKDTGYWTKRLDEEIKLALSRK